MYRKTAAALTAAVCSGIGFGGKPRVHCVDRGFDLLQEILRMERCGRKNRPSCNGQMNLILQCLRYKREQLVIAVERCCRKNDFSLFLYMEQLQEVGKGIFRIGASAVDGRCAESIVIPFVS